MTITKTDVYHWGPLHSKECKKRQYEDPWYFDCDSPNDGCDCEWDFALAYRNCPLETDSDGYIAIPPYTISAIDDRIDWLCDGHCTVAEAIEQALLDCLPGLDIKQFDSMAIENIACGEWSLRDLFVEEHVGLPTDPC